MSWANDRKWWTWKVSVLGSCFSSSECRCVSGPVGPASRLPLGVSLEQQVSASVNRQFGRGVHTLIPPARGARFGLVLPSSPQPTQVHTVLHTQLHTSMHTHAYAHTRTRTHTHTHTYKHTHTHFLYSTPFSSYFVRK